MSGFIDARSQEDTDALLQRRFEQKVAGNPKAIRAAAAMEYWHRNQRSDGKLPPRCPVIVLEPVRHEYRR